MRINVNSESQPISEGGREATQNKAASASGSAPGSILGEDQAQLSGAHVQVQALVAQVSQLPEVREERVLALRQTVQNGLYRATAANTAGALFDHMLDQSAA